jgi:hypothetical protein
MRMADGGRPLLVTVAILALTAIGSCGDKGGVTAGGQGLPAPPPPDAATLDPASIKGQLVGCDTYDPARVYALTTLRPSKWVATVSVDLETGAWCGVVRDQISVTAAALRPDGKLVSGERYVLNVFTRDPSLHFEERYGWALAGPGVGLDNDPQIATRCDDSFFDLFVWPETGEAAVGCLSGFGANPVITSGGRVVSPPNAIVHSVGYAGHALASVPIDPLRSERPLAIIDAMGNVTYLPQDLLLGRQEVLGARARPDGFLAALRVQPASDVELWKFAFDGTSIRVGVYADLPLQIPPPAGVPNARIMASYELGDRRRVQSALDADGVLYQFAGDNTYAPYSTKAYVVKRPLAPGATVIAFDDSKAPIPLSSPSRLITGP